MKKVIDLDKMCIIGYFEEKNSIQIKEKYLKLYDWAGFDIDGDLTVSMNNDK